MSAETDFSPTFSLYDRWGGYIRDLSDVRGATRDRQVGGADTLTLSTGSEISKGQRVVWCDASGEWHEHVASEPVSDRSGGAPTYECQCQTDLGDLRYFHVEDRVPSGGCETALAAALDGTGWEVGDVSGTAAQASITLYRCSALEAVESVAERWGGEPYATVEVDGAGVSRRLVNCPARQGAGPVPRLEFGRDLAGVRRTVSSEPVYTALRGYGRGVETDEGGFGRRLTFAEVNGGVDWVGDEDARMRWGAPGPGGERLHAFGQVVYEDVDDPAELLRLTMADLEQVKEPKVTYELEWVPAAASALGENVRPGADVEFVDTSFDPPLRGTARVLRVTEDLFDPSAKKVTLGDAADTVTSRIADLEASIASTRRRSATWEAASAAAPSFVTAMMAQQNALANAGMSYVVSSPTLGELCANVPLDPETGAPLERPAGGLSCVRKRAGVVQLATEHVGGEWQWSVAMSGAGIVADMVTAGTLNADLLRAGTIMDATGRNFWNLATGELSMMATGGEVQRVLNGVWTGRCVTAANQPGKLATLDVSEGFELRDGVMVMLQIGSTNTASAPTLDVNGTGAFPISINGQNLTPGTAYNLRGATWTTLVYGSRSPNNPEKVWSIADSGVSQSVNTTNTNVNTLNNTINSPQSMWAKLTNNGEIEGIALADGHLYINASYIASGIIADAAGMNSWNMETGELTSTSLPPGAFFGRCQTASATAAKTVTTSQQGFRLVEGAVIFVRWANDTNTASGDYVTLDVNGTGAKQVVINNSLISGNHVAIRANANTGLVYDGTYWRILDGGALLRANTAQRDANSALSAANTANEDLAELKTQEAIFNLLTANGTLKGVYMSGGQLYINADYIRSGTVVAQRLKNASGDSYATVGAVTVNGASMPGLVFFDEDGTQLGAVCFRKNSDGSANTAIVARDSSGTMTSVASIGQLGIELLAKPASSMGTRRARIYASATGGTLTLTSPGSSGDVGLSVTSSGVMVSNGQAQKWLATF